MDRRPLSFKISAIKRGRSGSASPSGTQYRRQILDLVSENDRLRRRIDDLEMENQKREDSMKEIMENETDEETRRFLMEEVTTTRKRGETLPPRKDVKKLFHTPFSIEKFKNRLQLRSEGGGGGKNDSENETFDYMFPYDMMKIFRKFDSLEFNVFDIESQPLLYVSMFFLTINGLLRTFRIPVGKMVKFVERIEQKYNEENQYHNSFHAADCIQTAHALICISSSSSPSNSEEDKTKKKKNTFEYLTSLDKLILFFSIIGHDLDHPGFSNRFLNITNYKGYAFEFNDQSPLEMHHTRSFFSIFRKCKLDEHFSFSENRKIREIVIDMILSTDPSKFNVIYKEQIKKLCAPYMTSSDEDDEINKQMEEEEESRESSTKGLLLLLMKCCDISNPTKSPLQYLEWTSRVMSEFYSQGDAESSRNLQVSAFMSRNSTSIPKCQIGFIKYLVFPAYRILLETDSKFEFIIEDLEAKMEFWELKMDEEERKNELYGLKQITRLKEALSYYLKKKLDIRKRPKNCRNL